MAVADPRFPISVVSYDECTWGIHWPMKLLNVPAKDIIHIPAQDRTIPNSVVVCIRLGNLKPELLRQIAVTPGIGMFHIADEWFREDYRIYENFCFAWRNYFHTGMQDAPVRQVPLGPQNCDIQDAWLKSEGQEIKKASNRAYTWTFSGYAQANRAHMLHCLSAVSGGIVHVTGKFDQPAASLRQEQYFSRLAQSVFAPCPMGNMTLESFRIYEALECGAIPIIERRKGFDYFARLLGPHPLPTVPNWRQAPSLIQLWMSDSSRLSELQMRCTEWWQAYKSDLSNALQDTCQQHANQMTRLHFSSWPVGRRKAFSEMWRHQCAASLRYRAALWPRRVWRKYLHNN